MKEELVINEGRGEVWTIEKLKGEKTIWQVKLMMENKMKEEEERKKETGNRNYRSSFSG